MRDEPPLASNKIRYYEESLPRWMRLNQTVAEERPVGPGGAMEKPLDRFHPSRHDAQIYQQLVVTSSLSLNH